MSEIFNENFNINVADNRTGDDTSARKKETDVLDTSVCRLCPNDCLIDRSTSIGACLAGNEMRIAKYYLHPYEEPPVSGTKGSGTIFFTGCSLKCRFCQNYDLSRNKRGKEITVNELADIFKKLEDMGAHNINLVTPTHYYDKIIRALDIYRPSIPILSNTHGYEKVEVLERLLPYIDVFLPDMKYCSPAVSERYTGKKNYFEVASRAIEFMINNKPPIYENGLIKQGVIVRHLILPMNVTDSKKILDWFEPYKGAAAFSLMSQYTPFGDTDGCPELKRKITKREYKDVLDYATSLGIYDLFVQDFKSADAEFIPDWDF